MSIHGIGMSEHSTSWRKRKTQKDIPGVPFARQIANANAATAGSMLSGQVSGNSAAGAAFGRDYYVRSAPGIHSQAVYSKDDLSAAQGPELPIETDRYKIEDASYIEGVAAYGITDKESGNSLYIREDQLVIQRDQGTGLEFVINMDQPFSCNVLVTGELKGLLNDILTGKGQPLEEIPLQGGLTVHRDSRTGLRYLAIQGDEARGMSVVIQSKKDMETLEKLADEFSRYPLCSSRSIAGLYALLEISGNLKREKDGMTFLYPDSIRYVPYDGNADKEWHLTIPRSDYSAARKYLATGLHTSSCQTWLERFPDARLFEKDQNETPRNLRSRGNMPDAGTDSSSEEQDAKTRSEIIVRPDGSRILILTMEIAGMQTAMSLQISEPTAMQNDVSSRETESKMTPVSEAGAVQNN